MKKYIKPTTEITLVNPISMMCMSIHEEEGNGIQLSKERETVDFSDEETLF